VNFYVINGAVRYKDEYNLYALVFGLVFLMMAGVIKEGIKLKAEQDLTI